jgi:hypothetical protein
MLCEKFWQKPRIWFVSKKKEIMSTLNADIFSEILKTLGTSNKGY